jgi:DNA-binding FadR family transcriptional regulator
MTNDNTEIFTSYQYRRASTDIAELIKKAILSDQFQEGDRLPAERDLAVQFQVGRMTIREALRTLETKGLIAIRKGSNGGAFVQPAPPDQIADIIVDNLELDGITRKEMTDSRVLLEKNIVKNIIENATPEDYETIEQNIERTKALVSDFTPEGANEFTAKSIEFHHLLVKAAHITPMIVFHSALAKWVSRSISPALRLSEEGRHWSNDSHEMILEAIKSGDVARSQELIESHIRRIINPDEKGVPL